MTRWCRARGVYSQLDKRAGSCSGGLAPVCQLSMRSECSRALDTRWFIFRGNIRSMNQTCKADGCGRATVARGLCTTHYARLRRSGKMEARSWQPRAQCTVEGCDRQSESGGYCGMHRWRMRTRGEPGPAGNIRPGREPAPWQICAVEGCGRLRKGASPYCHLHRERLRRTGELGPAQPTRVKGVVKPRSN